MTERPIPTRKPRLELMGDLSSFGECSFDPCNFDKKSHANPCSLLVALLNNDRMLEKFEPVFQFVKNNRHRWAAISYVLREKNGQIDFGEEQQIAQMCGITRRQFSRWINETNKIFPGIISRPTKRSATK